MAKPGGLGFGVEVEGVRELGRDFEKAGTDAGKMKAANLKVGAIVSAAALAEVPRRSGALAGSVRVTATKNSTTIRFGNNRRTGVPYALPIHFGWPRRGISPTPFLYDAADDRRVAVQAVYEQRVDAILKKSRL